MEEEERVNWSSPESGYTKEIDYESIIDETQSLPFGVVPITWKDGTTTYSYRGKEYTNKDEIPAFTQGNVTRYDWLDKAGEFVGNVIQSSPTLRTVLPPVAKGLSLLEMPGETNFATMVGDGAENWGIDRRLGEGLAYTVYPGLGELRPASKFLSQLDDVVTNPSYSKLNKDWEIHRHLSKSDTPSYYSSSKQPRLFKSKEKLQELDDYIEDAFQYRQSRVQAGGKQNLMKGYDKTILNESGQEYILVKKSKLQDSKNIASKSNYELRNKKDLELEIAARSGFEVKQDKDVKYLKMIVSELNKIEQQNPKLYLSTLMEYGDKAYLEHKVARRQFNWFWQRVEGNRQGDTFGKWVGTNNRNTEGNLRLLLDPNYKTLKDTTEGRLKKFDDPSLPDEERLVITIEDPNEAIFSAKSLFVRSNPGNILIKKAGSGETIGVIPDFYRQIYSTQFANAFKKNKNALSGPDVPEFLRVKGGEDITAYRDRIINKMIDDAIKGKVSMLGYEERYLEELADFYNTFTKLESKTAKPWVRKPSWVEEILETKEFDIPDTKDLTYKPISSLSQSEQIKLADLKDNLKTSLENKKVYESQFSKEGKTRPKTAITDRDYRRILKNISKYREEIKNILYPQKSLFDK